MGTGAGAFGGGRGHQGQDVFARCGTRLVAARAGVVKFKQYHSRAGHYIVIDGDNEGYDYAYMHLRDASLVDQGDHVYTGQPIGFVGDTGRAFGCHLHFEIWKAPGWYSGGSRDRPAAAAAGLGQDFVGSFRRRPRSARRTSTAAGWRWVRRVRGRVSVAIAASSERACPGSRDRRCRSTSQLAALRRVSNDLPVRS